jgi:hypothetical protein
MIVLDKFPTHIEYTDNKTAPNKFIKINNQSIYNGKLNRFSRAIAVKNLHGYIESKIKQSCCPIQKYPITITYIIKTVKNHGSISMRKGKLYWKEANASYVPNWDIDNLAFLWIKAINDTLVKSGIIPEDNVSYVKGGKYKIKYVKDLNNREIIIKFT